MSYVDADGGGRRLFTNLSFELPAGGILGVVGANGTGKTSLLRLISGEQPPSEGTVTLGPTVRLGYASQVTAAPPTSVSCRGRASPFRARLTPRPPVPPRGLAAPSPATRQTMPSCPLRLTPP